MSKLLIIEDDPIIVEGLNTAFAYHGFTVLTAGDSREGLELFMREKPHLVILDIMLPGLDGFDICKKIRARDQRTPIIMLTAKSQESDKLLGFELGADDYVTKPFSAKELIARVKAVLKRSSSGTKKKKEVTIGNVKVNFDNFTVTNTKTNTEYPLSPKEHDILKLFVYNPDIVISRSRIIDEVWGDEYFPSPKTIDNFVVKLRGKIEENPKKPRHILTVHGAGYKFNRKDS
ncbi:MAG: response regulator transcription factor [bacterium]|nr:response regulator transcription factor [bacterium]